MQLIRSFEKGQVQRDFQDHDGKCINMKGGTPKLFLICIVLLLLSHINVYLFLQHAAQNSSTWITSFVQLKILRVGHLGPKFCDYFVSIHTQNSTRGNRDAS